MSKLTMEEIFKKDFNETEVLIENGDIEEVVEEVEFNGYYDIYDILIRTNEFDQSIIEEEIKVHAEKRYNRKYINARKHLIKDKRYIIRKAWAKSESEIYRKDFYGKPLLNGYIKNIFINKINYYHDYNGWFSAKAMKIRQTNKMLKNIEKEGLMEWYNYDYKEYRKSLYYSFDCEDYEDNEVYLSDIEYYVQPFLGMDKFYYEDNSNYDLLEKYKEESYEYEEESLYDYDYYYYKEDFLYDYDYYE